MKKHIWNKILPVLLLVAVFGCKARKPLVISHAAVPVPVAAATGGKAEKFKLIRQSQLSFNTFSGKARAKLNIDGNSNDVTLNIRIKSGQRIWVSITAILGVEVARALITPDSILVVNRLQGLYLKKPFSYIYGYASRQVNYKTIESLLVGNAIPELLNPDGNLQATGNGTAISGNLQDLLYNITLNADNKATQTSLTSSAAGQALQVSNSVFMPAGNRVVPAQINIRSSVRNKNIQAVLHYSKAEFDQPQDYPFSIPSRFSPAD